MCRERSSKISRRSSCVSAHHPSDFVIGMSAAHVASGLPSGSSPAARALRSFRLTYRSLLVTPRRTHEASRGRDGSPPSKTLSRSAVGTGSPTTASTRPIRQGPVLPATNATTKGLTSVRLVAPPQAETATLTGASTFDTPPAEGNSPLGQCPKKWSSKKWSSREFFQTLRRLSSDSNPDWKGRVRLCRERVNARHRNRLVLHVS